MNSKTIVALAALEQKLDTILFAREDEDHTGRNIAIAGAGTAAAGGGMLVDRAIMRKHGQRQLLGSGEIQPGSPRSLLGRTAASGATSGGSAGLGRGAAYRQAGGAIVQNASNIGRAARVAGKQAYRVTRDNGEGLLTSVGRGLRKAGKVAISKARALEAGVDPRVLELVARADELVVEFAPKESREGRVARATGAAIVAGGAAAGGHYAIKANGGYRAVGNALKRVVKRK